jgi:hypothetical protein
VSAAVFQLSDEPPTVGMNPTAGTTVALRANIAASTLPLLDGPGHRGDEPHRWNNSRAVRE